MLLPATPGWVSLLVVVGGPHHSWLGSVGGGGVWCVVCGGGVLVGLWLVCGVVGPRHSWRRFLCATPRHSWLGFAAGGGGRSPLLPAGVRWRRWCVVCGVLVGLWLVCGVVGPSPLLAEVPVCYSPPLLAGFRCRWWWAVPATPGWGPLAAVVCGVWRWCVVGVVVGVCCGWSLTTPGGGPPCVLLPATPGWVSLPVVVGGPRHSWLGSVGGGGVWCVVCGVWCVGGVPRHSWRRFLCATPRHSWLGFAAGGGGRSPPLLAGVRWRRWCPVCACFAWPGRAGRPHGRVLVRLTFSLGCFVFLLCLAPSGLGLPPSLLPLLPFLVGCFPRLPAAWLSVRSGLAAFWWLLPRPPPLLCLAVFVAPAWGLGVFLSFFFFSSSSSVRPRCLRLPVVSGPGCPGPQRCALFALLAFRFSALHALVPLSCFPPGCWLLPGGCCPSPPPFLSRGFRRCRSVLCAVCCVVLCVPGCGAAPRCCALCPPVLCCGVFFLVFFSFFFFWE